MLKLVLPQNS